MSKGKKDPDAGREVLPPLPEKARNGVEIGPRYRAVDLLQQNGFSVTETAKALGISRVQAGKIKNKIAPKYDLTSRKYLKLAAHAVKSTLSGEAVGSADAPKASTVLQAAQMVYDRVQPVQKAADAPQTTNFIQVNIDQYNER